MKDKPGHNDILVLKNRTVDYTNYLTLG